MQSPSDKQQTESFRQTEPSIMQRELPARGKTGDKPEVWLTATSAGGCTLTVGRVFTDPIIENPPSLCHARAVPPGPNQPTNPQQPTSAHLPTCLRHTPRIVASHPNLPMPPPAAWSLLKPMIIYSTQDFDIALKLEVKIKPCSLPCLC